MLRQLDSYLYKIADQCSEILRCFSAPKTQPVRYGYRDFVVYALIFRNRFEQSRLGMMDLAPREGIEGG